MSYIETNIIGRLTIIMRMSGERRSAFAFGREVGYLSRQGTVRTQTLPEEDAVRLLSESCHCHTVPCRRSATFNRSV